MILASVAANVLPTVVLDGGASIADHILESQASRRRSVTGSQRGSKDSFQALSPGNVTSSTVLEA